MNQLQKLQDKFDNTFRKFLGECPADVFFKVEKFAKMTGVKLAESLDITNLVICKIEKKKNTKETGNLVNIL